MQVLSQGGIIGFVHHETFGVDDRGVHLGIAHKSGHGEAHIERAVADLDRVAQLQAVPLHVVDGHGDFAWGDLNDLVFQVKQKIKGSILLDKTDVHNAVFFGDLVCLPDTDWSRRP